MTLAKILDNALIPLLMFAFCLGDGIMLIYTKNPKTLISKDTLKRPQDPEKYAVEAGKLMLLFAAGALLMAVLSFVNVYAEVFESLIVLMVFLFLWKKMSDKYGPK